MKPNEYGWEEGSVSEQFDKLLTDYGCYVGQPLDRGRAVRRIVEGAHLTAEDAENIRWFFDYAEMHQGIRNMGAFIASKVSSIETCIDLAKGSATVRDRARKKTQKKGGQNLHRETTNPEIAQFERQVVRDFVEQHSLDRVATCEFFEIDNTRLEHYLIEHYDLLAGFAAAGPKKLRDKCEVLHTKYHALWEEEQR